MHEAHLVSNMQEANIQTTIKVHEVCHYANDIMQKTDYAARMKQIRSKHLSDVCSPPDRDSVLNNLLICISRDPASFDVGNVNLWNLT